MAVATLRPEQTPQYPAIKPGMTIEQLVKNFPNDFNFGQIGANESQPCTEKGLAAVQPSVNVKPGNCLPPAKSFTVFRADENYSITVHSEEWNSANKTLSSAELASLLNTEFAGRAWHANFTFLNITPRHYSFTVSVGADGKVQEAPRISSMD